MTPRQTVSTITSRCLTGMDEDGFAALCRDIFREGGGGSNA